MSSILIIRIANSDMASMFGLLLGLVISLTQAIHYRRKRAPVFWFALTNIAGILGFAELFLFKTGLILKVPHAYRVGLAFSLLQMPLAYLYVRSAMLDLHPTYVDLVHALPFGVFIFDHLAFFTSSASEKLSAINSPDNIGITAFTQGTLLTSGFYFFLIVFTYLIYWIAELLVLVKHAKASKRQLSIDSSPWAKWLFFFLLMQILTIIPTFVIFLAGDAQYLVDVAGVCAIVSAGFISASIFVHPQSLQVPANGYFAFSTEVTQFSSRALPDGQEIDFAFSKPEELKPVKLTKNLSAEQIQKVKEEIEKLLREEEPFLKHGYALQDMSFSLSRPLYQVSAIINQVYESNFNELINKYRIHYAIKLINEKQSRNLNIHGLADRCGFSNRNSFTAAFKKVTGHTPSDYSKQH